MSKFFAPNINRKGRIVRAAIGLLLVMAGLLSYQDLSWRRWVTAGLVLSGGFVLFEAVRGWCLARACGIKTKL